MCSVLQRVCFIENGVEGLQITEFVQSDGAEPLFVVLNVAAVG